MTSQPEIILNYERKYYDCVRRAGQYEARCKLENQMMDSASNLMANMLSERMLIMSAMTLRGAG